MAINVVLEDPQLTVLGPPAQVELNVNSGETGPRGSYIYSGSGNPNTNTLLTDKILGDLFIRTDDGFDYGSVYQYSAVPGPEPEWVKILDINVDTSDIASFVTTASAFALSASISAISSEEYSISASGFALSSSISYLSILGSVQEAISSASNALISEQNALSYYLSSSSFYVLSETNALNSFNSAVSASNNALNSFDSAISASISAACALYLTSLNNSYAASSEYWASIAEQSVSSGVASAAYWAGVSEQFSIDAAASAAYWVDIAEQNALSASNLYVTRDNEINTTIDFRSASVMFTSSSVSGIITGIDDATAIAYASSASANVDIRAFEYASSASANSQIRFLIYENSASASADARALEFAVSASANADIRALGYASSASANVATRSVSKTGDTMSGILTAQNYNITTASVSSNTIALDFSTGEGLQTVNVSSSVTFTGSNYVSGAIKTIRIISDGSTRTLTFPSNWIFVGAKPINIFANKNGILTVTSFGTTEANCVAAWAVQY